MKKRKNDTSFVGCAATFSSRRRLEKVGRRIVVEHPVHGRHEAEGVKDRLQAVQSAAKAWGGLQWSTIARECTFTEVKANDAVDSGG